jgi:hypothetical protein
MNCERLSRNSPLELGQPQNEKSHERNPAATVSKKYECLEAAPHSLLGDTLSKCQTVTPLAHNGKMFFNNNLRSS